MIDIKLIRENPELVKENIKKKFKSEKLPLVDKVKKLDEQWRKLKYEEDGLRSERNKISEQINQLMKSKKKAEAEKLIKEAKKIPEKISQSEEKRKGMEVEIKVFLSSIPNLISSRVPSGKDDSQNVVEKVIGKPEKFTFPVLSHAEIAEKLGLADFDSSARVSGNGFYYLEGDLALLNQALIHFAIDKMVSHGFRYVETPLMLNNEIINRVTDLNDQEVMIYRLANEDKSLIGTSEHSLIGRFVDQEIDFKRLPIKHTSYSMCFRKEIGSHSIDEKGLFRTHQFNKVEMIVICDPKDSSKFFEELKNISVEIFKELELPVRILKICSGDLGDLKHEQIDLEVWSPRKKSYFEVGSCSNLTDAQARKLGISTRVKGEKVVPHTLNNTAIATSRALVAILENNQQKDGSVKIPKVLQKYIGGKKVLKGSQ
ncbi:MAG: serine--tRNA ligase [Nanoarchaeota archaeon]|nr:serine--tRNA ligase [Nanoarchaeota archaeon]